MRKVEDLRAGWEFEKASEKAASEKKTKKNKVAPDAEDEGLFPEEGEDTQEAPPSTANLFDDSDESDAEPSKREDDAGKSAETEEKATEEPAVETTQQDLFGDSSDGESDEELVPSGTKRGNVDKDADEEQASKKRKVSDKDDGD
jgi:hypothetical protein